MGNKNKEGYPDPTAAKAIRKANKTSERARWFIDTIYRLADIMDLEIVGRVQVRDKKTKKAYF